MKMILESIDSAIKRLVSPTAMIVAAAVLAEGMNKDESNQIVIQSLVWVLSLFAFGYMIASYKVAFKEIEDSGHSKLTTGIISLAFMLVYFVLILVGIKFGIDKVG